MAAEGPADFSPEWWDETQGERPDSGDYVRTLHVFDSWESTARRRAHAALAEALTAAREASLARERVERAYDRTVRWAATSALETCEDLLIGRALRYLSALERHQARLAEIDAIAGQALKEGKAARDAIKTVRKRLKRAARATEKAVAGRTGVRIARALDPTGGETPEDELAMAVWEGVLRGLGDKADEAGEKAKPGKGAKSKKKDKKKRKAKGRKKKVKKG